MISVSISFLAISFITSTNSKIFNHKDLIMGCSLEEKKNILFVWRLKPSSYLMRTWMQMRSEFDVTTALSQRYSQVSCPELNCCEYLLRIVWRQHSLLIRRKYEPVFTPVISISCFSKGQYSHLVCPKKNSCMHKVTNLWKFCLWWE